MALFDGFFNRQPKETMVVQSPQDKIFNDVAETIKLGNIELPKPVESKYREWVTFGQHNQFPLDLIEYRSQSALHAAILESKSMLIAGEGLIFGKTKEESDAWLLANFTKVPFIYKLNYVWSQVVNDQETFGYSCFEVIYSMDHTKILDINWVDASRIASGKMNERGIINEYYYSENWRTINQTPPVKIDAFDPNNKDSHRQLVFIRRQESNMDYFGLPSYYSALKWIKADGLMAEYNLAAINNGFSPSIVFKFFKKPTPEERRIIVEGIKGQHGGAKNAGKAIFLFSDGKELAPEVQTLDVTNLDNRLLQVADQIVQQIISGHRAYPQLQGIQISGKLGLSNEMIQSWKIFDTMVIRPEQEFILQHFRNVLRFNGVDTLEVQKLVPIDLTPQGQQPQNPQNIIQ